MNIRVLWMVFLAPMLAAGQDIIDNPAKPAASVSTRVIFDNGIGL